MNNSDGTKLAQTPNDIPAQKCRAQGTGQCAAICLSHSSNVTANGECPERFVVWDDAARKQWCDGVLMRGEVRAKALGESTHVSGEQFPLHSSDITTKNHSSVGA